MLLYYRTKKIKKMNGENTLFKIEKQITRIEKAWTEFAHIGIPMLTIVLGIFSFAWEVKISAIAFSVIPTILILPFRTEIGNGKIITAINFFLLLILVLASASASLFGAAQVALVSIFILVGFALCVYFVPKEVQTFDSLLESR